MKLRRPHLAGWGRRMTVGLTAAVVAPMILVAFAGTAQAASSEGCEGGGFSRGQSGRPTAVQGHRDDGHENIHRSGPR